MKKVLFSFFMVSLLALGAQAQKSGCSQPCTKSASNASSCHAKSTSTASTHCGPSSEAAAKLAASDPTIETRTCATSGHVSYVRKASATVNGKTTYEYVDVSYDAATNSFVNVAPSEVLGTKAPSCAPGTSASVKKSGCASNASGKTGCCAQKGNTASAVSTGAPQGQAIKTSNPSKN